MWKLVKIIILVLIIAIIAGMLWLYFAGDGIMTGYYYNQGINETDSLKAINFFEMALKRDENNKAARLSMVERYIYRENFVKAEYYLLEGIKLAPNDADYYTWLSSVYVRQDKVKDAVELFEGLPEGELKNTLYAKKPQAPEISVTRDFAGNYVITVTGNDAYVSLSGEYPSMEMGKYEGPITTNEKLSRVCAISIDNYGICSSLVVYNIG